MSEPSSPSSSLAPIYCFADSQGLFWRPQPGDATPDVPEGEPFLASLLEHLPGPPEDARAAYIGASNGDDPAFYSIFEAAMESVGIGRRRQILSDVPAEDREFLEAADVILLAGGDPARGWEILEATGMDEILRQRHQAGAVLCGVSAGAVQLGWLAAPAAPGGDPLLTLRLVPAVIGAHEEADDWAGLRRLVAGASFRIRGLGIPSGGAVIYHPDQTLEPVRVPVHEIVATEDGTRHTLLLPGDPTTALPEDAPAPLTN